MFFVVYIIPAGVDQYHQEVLFAVRGVVFVMLERMVCARI